MTAAPQISAQRKLEFKFDLRASTSHGLFNRGNYLLVLANDLVGGWKKIYLSQTTQQDIFRALQMPGYYRKPRSSLIKLTRLSKFLSIPLIATVAAWPACTTRQAARFLFTDVTVTGWKEPSCDGPRRSWSPSRKTPLTRKQSDWT